jgi:hypothetical protein
MAAALSACFNTKNRCILPAQCICVFHMALTINSDCYPKQQQPVGFCNGDGEALLWGRNSVFNTYRNAVRSLKASNSRKIAPCNIVSEAKIFKT